LTLHAGTHHENLRSGWELLTGEGKTPEAAPPKRERPARIPRWAGGAPGTGAQAARLYAAFVSNLTSGAGAGLKDLLLAAHLSVISFLSGSETVETTLFASRPEDGVYSLKMRVGDRRWKALAELAALLPGTTEPYAGTAGFRELAGPDGASLPTRDRVTCCLFYTLRPDATCVTCPRTCDADRVRKLTPTH